MKPADYDAWYQTPRGNWISDTEFQLMSKLLRPGAGESLLDVGCGTGHFSRRFTKLGLHVTGIDPDTAMLDFAKSQNNHINYIDGTALALPFTDHSFDYVVAITSLCFVTQPAMALKEMWRVCRKSLVVGLLNRHSVLYYQKHNQGGYQGARWDTKASVKSWLTDLHPQPQAVAMRTAVFMPGYHRYERKLEKWISNRVPFGVFMAVQISRQRG